MSSTHEPKHSATNAAPAADIEQPAPDAPLAADIEQPAPEPTQPSELSATVDKLGKVAMSAMLATSLSAALSEPPRHDLMSLADPTPIVQEYEPQHKAPEPEPDPEPEQKDSHWFLRLMQILKFLVVAAAIVLVALFATARGCASCAAPLLTQDEQQEEQDKTDEPADEITELDVAA